MERGEVQSTMRPRRNFNSINWTKLFCGAVLSYGGYGFFLYTTLKTGPSKLASLTAFLPGIAGVFVVNIILRDLSLKNATTVDPSDEATMPELTVASPKNLGVPNKPTIYEIEDLDLPSDSRTSEPGSKLYTQICAILKDSSYEFENNNLCTSCNDARLKCYEAVRKCKELVEQAEKGKKIPNLYDLLQIALDEYRKEQGLKSAVDEYNDSLVEFTEEFKKDIDNHINEFKTYLVNIMEMPQDGITCLGSKCDYTLDTKYLAKTQQIAKRQVVDLISEISESLKCSIKDIANDFLIFAGILEGPKRELTALQEVNEDTLDENSSSIS